ncbi:hypothetical protein BJX63DRAFT_437258 [Aspergillus granulosus]|uniref:Uncharacterized protein n=1 Tax=Aspergillus granulosus TaxID=176169 RepID=A0ABR4GVK9_9EURO
MDGSSGIRVNNFQTVDIAEIGPGDEVGAALQILPPSSVFRCLGSVLTVQPELTIHEPKLKNKVFTTNVDPIDENGEKLRRQLWSVLYVCESAQVIEAINHVIRTMKQLSDISRTAITAFGMLSHLIRQLNKKDRFESAPSDGPAPRLPGSGATIGPDKAAGLVLLSPELHGNESEIASMKDLRLGLLGEMWGLDSLDLDCRTAASAVGEPDGIILFE